MPLSSSSSFLTNADISGLQTIILVQAVNGILYGIEFLCTVSTSWLLYQNGFKTSPMRVFLIVAITTMFLSSTMTMMDNLTFYSLELRSLSDPTYDFFPTTSKWDITDIVFTRISYLLGDIIVVWRAWILFQQEFVPRCILAVCMVQSLGCSIYNAVLAVQDLLSTTASELGNPIRVIQPASLLFTNMVATVLVFYKIWQYRRSIQQLLGKNRNKRSQVENILILVIESSAVYCIFWILVIPDIFSKTYHATAGNYVDIILPHVETIYATAIVFLSQLGKTHCETTLQGQIISTRSSMELEESPHSSSIQTYMHPLQPSQFQPNPNPYYVQAPPNGPPSSYYQPPQNPDPYYVQPPMPSNTNLNSPQSVTFVVDGDTLTNASFLTPEGIALYRSETKTSALSGSDKKTVVYKLEHSMGHQQDQFPYVPMATIEKHSFHSDVVKVWDREVKPIKLTPMRGSVEFSGSDGHSYKWKQTGLINSEGFKLQRQDTSTIELGSFSTKESRSTLRFEKDVFHVMEECIAALVLGGKNQKQIAEAAAAASEVTA
ncbi:hypothetical protein D9758_003576 [Tetrapyrgos nigripes]|uniref:DUF6593 domain-containing protein n=1 Tax=Tetrapyrgos nigripes TaxID=182062 RepID=A0A8H5GUS3_9AGAR|nr:hypothetical protein D9758_003576 [Tetrapyrgos nigripes]